MRNVLDNYLIKKTKFCHSIIFLEKGADQTGDEDLIWIFG
jgi:hypothetical protein